MLSTGVALLVSAGCGGSSSTSEKSGQFKKGGTLRVGDTTDIDAIDPQIAYGTISWWLEYATAAKLYNYPDKEAPEGTRIVPEVAERADISRDGKTYTFTIRKGFKFSDGKPVTAANFKFAFERTLSKKLNSPGGPFFIDPAATNIVGGAAYYAGKAKSVSGIQVQGNKLVIHLTKASGGFLSQLAMPFVQATPLSLPLDRPILSVSGTQLPSAGPYYVSSRVPNRIVELKRNPFYKSGPGRTRPHNLDGVHFDGQLNAQTGYLQVLANEVDQGPLPAANAQEVAKRFGVNKTRFWVKPQACVLYLAMNVSRPLFKNNLKLRQAVNYIIRRREIANQTGLYGATPYTHILPPGVPGSAKIQPYPADQPDIAKAKSLAKGNTRSGVANLYYFSDRPEPVAEMEIERADLAKIGITAKVRGFRGFALFDEVGSRNSQHDITQAGWCQDYPDPYDFINILLYGGSLHATHNSNVAYFNDPALNKKMVEAARKVGDERLKAYRELDDEIMKNYAPWAVTSVPNNRFIFSDRVDPRSLVYQGAYQNWSIPALALK
jgi:ABC-type oligopeptide transport system substrate-binding subunit